MAVRWRRHTHTQRAIVAPSAGVRLSSGWQVPRPALRPHKGGAVAVPALES